MVSALKRQRLPKTKSSAVVLPSLSSSCTACCRHGFCITLQFSQMSRTIDRKGSGHNLQVGQISPFARTTSLTQYSHIFCLPCAGALGLASAANSQRICPACSTSLPNPDDAVRTQLNPTEDYKTSVLSGLSPAIITECAGRALGFWSYQSSQEMSVYWNGDSARSDPSPAYIKSS